MHRDIIAWIGRGAMGDEREVGARVKTMGIAPCQLDCWREILEAGMHVMKLVLTSLLILLLLLLPRLSPLLEVEVGVEKKTVVAVSPSPPSP